MYNIPEILVFKLEEPTQIKWRRFKELQTEINKASQGENLKTNSVEFDDKKYESNIELIIPSESNLKNAAIKVCNIYSKNGIKHKLISRSIDKAFNLDIKVLLQYQLLNPTISRWNKFTKLENFFTDNAPADNVKRYYKILDKKNATCTAIYVSLHEDDFIKMIHNNTILLGNYELDSKIIKYEIIKNLDFSDEKFKKMGININEPWEQAYKKELRRKDNRKYYYLKQGVEPPLAKKELTLEERKESKMIKKEKDRKYYYLMQGVEPPPAKKELTLKEKKEKKRVYLKKYYIENKENIMWKRMIFHNNGTPVTGQKEKEREYIMQEYLKKSELLTTYQKKVSKKYNLQQVKELKYHTENFIFP